MLFHLLIAFSMMSLAQGEVVVSPYHSTRSSEQNIEGQRHPLKPLPMYTDDVDTCNIANRLSVSDIDQITLDGRDIVPYIWSGPGSDELGPLVVKDRRMIRLFLEALRHSTTYSARYAGPYNALFLELTPRNGIARPDIEIAIQPTDFHYNGLAFHKALESLGDYYAGQTRGRVHALRVHRSQTTIRIYSGNNYTGPLSDVRDIAEVHQILDSLEHLDRRGFVWTQQAQDVLVDVTTQSPQPHKESFHLRIPIYDPHDMAKNCEPYPGLALDMKHPPVPTPLWRRIFQITYPSTIPK